MPILDFHLLAKEADLPLLFEKYFAPEGVSGFHHDPPPLLFQKYISL